MTNTSTLSGSTLITQTYSRSGTYYGLEVSTPMYSVHLVWHSHDDLVRVKGTRVYDAFVAFIPGFDDEESRLFQAIPDHSVKDPKLAAFHRSAKKAAKAAFLPVLEDLASRLRAAGHAVHFRGEVTAVFSQKAGCSCPCSPGFVLSKRFAVDGRVCDLHFRPDSGS